VLAEVTATSMVVSRRAQSSSCSSLVGLDTEEDPPEQVVQVEEEDAVEAAEEGGTRTAPPDVAVSKVSMALVWVLCLCGTGRARGRARGGGRGERCDAGGPWACNRREGRRVAAPEASAWGPFSAEMAKLQR